MKKFLVLIPLSLLLAGSAWSFDRGLAGSYEQFFAQFDGRTTPKALHVIKTPDFVSAVQSGQKMFILDIRTPAETRMYGLTLPDSHAIPMNEVFKTENLSRIPTDQKVVVVCKAGHRAMAIAMALRHVGFENVFVLKYGIADLAKYLSPKNAYLPGPKLSSE